MKTALFNTDYWKDEKYYSLNTDTRHIFLAILTNPERNTTPAFKCSDRMMMAYTGFSIDIIQLARKQLIDGGFIKYIDGYYIILGENYIKPTKGKLTSTLYEKSFNLLPDLVKKEINLLMSDTGTIHEYKDNNKDKDNNNIIIKTNYDIEEDIFSFWNEQNIIKHKFESVQEDITKALKKFTLEEIKTGIKNYADVYHSKKTWWSHKWTLSELLKRDNGLKVFIYKTEQDYISKSFNESPKSYRDSDEASKKLLEKIKAKVK